MRQAGILAAAGRYALRHHIDRLAEDHARAARLAEALAPFGVLAAGRSAPTSCRWTSPRRTLDAPALAAAARAEGVLVSVLGPRTGRLVTHLDVDDAGIDRAIAVLTRILRA